MAAPAALRKSSFAPVADAGARLLVLGSLPGEMSLRIGQYYGNPQNQFWRLMGAALGRELPGVYEARLEVLQGAGVALWDVVRSAVRPGSLDGRIRDHQPNPLADFAATLPRLRAVAFNGKTAAAIGARALADVAKLELMALPSSSPAYTLAFERKAEAWAKLRRFLEP
ncbi:MAG TPA: DNA-deoxyinosine glycosylase [Caulobacteraceae bacterium]|nr:DNA-deoxyinosine glycosylase [Caulobacteraceae bacterium]